MTGPDIEGLRKFVTDTDRDTARLFVGRDDEIAKVEAVAAKALEMVTVDKGRASSMTLVFQGAPGAGKTSLLNHLMDREEAPYVAVDLRPPDLRTRRSVAAAVAEALNRRSGKVFDRPRARWFAAIAARFFGRRQDGAARTSISRTEGGIDAGFGGLRHSRETITEIPEASLDTLARKFPAERWKCPLVLLIDEAQGLEKERHGDVVFELHHGKHGLPLVPVLAGLGNTADRLENLNLTRFSEGHVLEMGALGMSDAAAAVRKFLARFRIDVPPERAAWWGAELARRSDGWPQHLHTALQGLADELLRVDADIMRVREAAVFANGRLRRIESYGRRQSPAMKDARSLVAELMARIPAGGRDLGAVVDDIVALHAAGGGKASSSLPDGFSAAGFRDHLVYRGALQQAGDHRELLACPIPSFRDWLIERGRDEQPAPSGGKRDRSPAARPRKSVRKGPGGMG